MVALEWTLRLQATGQIAPLPGEHVLRAPHPTRGWALAPGRRAHQRNLDFDVLVETSSSGFRDRERALAKPPGVLRIAVLGDSFMEAYQVALEEALPARLERALSGRGVEVLNFGVGGYGTAQALRTFDEEVVRYAPDLVVLAFYVGNDVQNNSRALQRRTWGPDADKVWARPYAVLQPDGTLTWQEPDIARLAEARALADARRSRPVARAASLVAPTVLTTRVKQAAARFGARLGSGPRDPRTRLAWPFASPRADPDWEPAWAVTRRLVTTLRDRAAAEGAPLVMLLVPAKLQVEPAFRRQVEGRIGGAPLDPFWINTALASFAESEAILLVDPTASLVATSEGGAPVYHGIEDHHWNARGHAVAAQLLAAALDESGLLPPMDRGAGAGRGVSSSR